MVDTDTTQSTFFEHFDTKFERLYFSHLVDSDSRPPHRSSSSNNQCHKAGFEPDVHLPGAHRSTGAIIYTVQHRCLLKHCNRV